MSIFTEEEFNEYITSAQTCTKTQFIKTLTCLDQLYYNSPDVYTLPDEYYDILRDIY